MLRQSSCRSFSIVLLISLLTIGCGHSRPPRTQADLLAIRHRNDEQYRAESQRIMSAMTKRVDAEYSASAGGATTGAAPPVVNILIISGGGDWGAFGAGLLKGWSKVNGPMARPNFDIVTGVSTGALIAPFAFLGDEVSNERVVHLYRNPKKDWAKQRWPLYFYPTNISFAEVPGLERELRENVDEPMVRRIADEAPTGRLLLLNTSNVDDGGMQVWDLVDEARAAVQSNPVKLDRVHNIMLASSGIPGAFPFRIIDDQLYVDGGITGNILYGTRMREEDSFQAVWSKTHPGTAIPKMRFWVIFNNQLRPLPQVTDPAWPAVVGRSLEMSTRSATLVAIRHLHAQAEISRLKRGADVEVRVVAIPNDWAPPKPGIFVKETMNALVDLGEKMGADPASWSTDEP